MSPNIPQHSAQGLSPQGITAPPQGGLNRHLMLQPPKQPGPEFKFARGHGTRGRPQTQILWSDGLGMVSKPRRCHEHPWAYRYAYETHTSHPPSPTVRPRTQYRGRLCPPRPSAGWALQQLASVGKTSRFWGLSASEREGFKGEWMEKALGANQHKEYWRTGNAGSFRANEWRNAVGWGESKAKRFDGE